jgi:hypothetical protein
MLGRGINTRHSLVVLHFSKMLLTTSVLVLALVCVSVYAKTFVVPHTPGHDDTPGLKAALANFTSNSTILFKAGVTYNIFTPITFPILNNVEIQIEGNLTYPTSISDVQGVYMIIGWYQCVAYVLDLPAALVSSVSYAQ